MSEHMFGVSRDKPSRADAKRIETIAKEHGAELVEATLPGGGYQRWFTCRNRGEPFNSRTAQAVRADLVAAGLAEPSGPKPATPGEPINKVITIKVSEAQLARWRTVADREGVTLSEWLRDAAEARARGSREA